MEARDRPGPTAEQAQKSRKSAIEAKCVGCIYDESGYGTWRQQIAACTAFECPLWMHRPLPTGGAPAWPSKVSAMLVTTAGLSAESVERWKADPRVPPEGA